MNSKLLTDTEWIATLFEAKRTAYGWSMRRLSQESGVCVQTVSNIESGAIQPSFDAVMRIAYALDIHPVTLWRNGEWENAGAVSGATLTELTKTYLKRLLKKSLSLIEKSERRWIDDSYE